MKYEYKENRGGKKKNLLEEWMAIGFYIRKMLGPFEQYVTDIYRSIFFDIAEFVDYIKRSIPVSDGLHILDLGCGEGTVTSLLARTFSHAYITGVDISPSVGRLFHGDLSRVYFEQRTIEDIAAETPQAFDIVIISDVMHHIPWEKHRELLIQVKKVLKLGGYIVLKDWARNMTLIFLLAYLSDRFITGDKVYFRTCDAWKSFIKDVFSCDPIRPEERIRPWSNNIVFIIQP